MLKGETLSARGLARWLRARLPAAGGFGPATLEGRLAAADSGGRLSDATLTLDGATATGTLALDLSGAKPLVAPRCSLAARSQRVLGPLRGRRRGARADGAAVLGHRRVGGATPARDPSTIC